MKIAVIDLETTGTSPETGTIVEVGCCLLDLETRFITKLLDTVVKEKQLETKFEASSLKKCWVFQHTGLTVSQVRNGPSWASVKPKIQIILNKFPTAAYNSEFDFNFLKSRDLTILHPLPCPMYASAPVLEIPSKEGIYEYKLPSLQEVWNFFFPANRDYTQLHRAYDDAYREALIIYKLYQKNAWKPAWEK
jgi:DNA polymerase III epsilon subunit-like protein